MRVSSSVTPVTPPAGSPWISTTAAFSFQAIFGFMRARSSMIFDARKSSRRWITVTFEANFVRKVASSIAVSPPPTTATSFALKKKPSQVAQAETPRPISLASDSSPSSFAEAPEETMTASAVSLPERVEGQPERARGEVDVGHRVEHDLGAEAPGLLPEDLHQLGPLDPVAKAGVVLDLGRDRQLPAGLRALDDERLELGARSVERGGPARGPGTDDGDAIVALGRGHSCLRRRRRISAGRPVIIPTVRPALARKLEGFGTTIFTEMTRLAQERGAVNLAQGFPDFDGPEFVKEAAIDAVRAGRGQYARMSGIPEVHAALSAKYRRDYGLDYAPDTELTVTSGATEAIFAADPGDVRGGGRGGPLRAVLRLLQAERRDGGSRGARRDAPRSGLELRPRRGARAVTPATRAILVNTPHNPTGKVFSPDELEFLAALCRERDLLCITDEVYEHLVYDGAHVPMATLPGMRERTITISSFGKTFSLTGWKIGWAAAPPELTAAVRAAHQFITFATATPLQHGAAAALSAGPEYYRALAAEYRDRRDLLCGELARLGFGVRAPAGTYFVCADFTAFGFEDDVAFCRHLVEEIGVAAIPPSSFYDHKEQARGYVRFAFCKREATLREAVRRLEKLRP